MNVHERTWAPLHKKQQEADAVRTRLMGDLRNENKQLEVPKRKGMKQWTIALPLVFDYEQEQWLVERSRQAMIVLRNSVESRPGKLGGAPVLKGTRFSVTQLLAELADSDAVEEIADNFELDKNEIRQFLHAFSVYLNRPMA